MMTAAVAWNYMTPGARCRAVMPLQSDPEYSRGLQNPNGINAGQALFVNAATWPDRIKAQGSGFMSDGDDPVSQGPNASVNIGLTDHRMHKYWHFIDYPVPANGGPPAPAVNAVERVMLFTSVLANPATPMPVKAYDLVWTLHLVGDLHQPLHTTTQYGSVFPHNSDAGGNAVAVTFPGYQELHGFWDGTPGDSKNLPQELSVSVNAITGLPSIDPTSANKLDPAAWAGESYQLALKYAFVPPVVEQSVGPIALTQAYVDNAKTIGRGQVAPGGIRLGYLLNQTLRWPAPGCP